MYTKLKHQKLSVDHTIQRSSSPLEIRSYIPSSPLSQTIDSRRTLPLGHLITRLFLRSRIAHDPSDLDLAYFLPYTSTTSVCPQPNIIPPDAPLLDIDGFSISQHSSSSTRIAYRLRHTYRRTYRHSRCGGGSGSCTYSSASLSPFPIYPPCIHAWALHIKMGLRADTTLPIHGFVGALGG